MLRLEHQGRAAKIILSRARCLSKAGRVGRTTQPEANRPCSTTSPATAFASPSPTPTSMGSMAKRSASNTRSVLWPVASHTTSRRCPPKADPPQGPVAPQFEPSGTEPTPPIEPPICPHCLNTLTPRLGKGHDPSTSLRPVRSCSRVPWHATEARCHEHNRWPRTLPKSTSNRIQVLRSQLVQLPRSSGRASREAIIARKTCSTVYSP